ncbi:MAG: hypothetical protein Q8J72_11175 [Rhodocyclaceae bacterium]|jgi:hypothetical protein|nr:hypothetical protein [Rhodocyclaceae bacterium]
MSTLKIDDSADNLGNLSGEAKSILNMFKLTEQESLRRQLQLTIARTARNPHGQAIRAQLPTPLEAVQAHGEAIKVS